MKNKMTFILIVLCVFLLSAQETGICSWIPDSTYNEDDIVLYETA